MLVPWTHLAVKQKELSELGLRDSTSAESDGVYEGMYRSMKYRGGPTSDGIGPIACSGRTEDRCQAPQYTELFWVYSTCLVFDHWPADTFIENGNVEHPRMHQTRGRFFVPAVVDPAIYSCGRRSRQK